MVFARLLGDCDMSQMIRTAYNTVIESMGLPKAYEGGEVNVSLPCCLACEKPILQACNCARPKFDEKGICTNYHVDYMCAGRREGTVCDCSIPFRQEEKFVSLYAVVDVPGGPEEGGWWTSTIHLEASHECASQEEAYDIKQKILSIAGKPTIDNDTVRYMVCLDDQPGRRHSPKACTMYN